MEQRTRTATHIAVLSLLVIGFRVVPWLSRLRLTFDEGVFLASNDLVSSGLTPFQDFFSSQGPLFLPLLRLGQVLSFGDPRGPRTTLIAASVTITISLYFILLRYTSPARAVILSSFAAVSGTVLLAAGPVQSDGIALGLAMAALALHLSDRRTMPNGLLIGALLGAAVAVKSLHVVPIVLVIVAVSLWRFEWKALALIAASSVAVVLATSIPFGLDLVWDQYVAFHLAKDNSPDVIENFSSSIEFLFEFDKSILALFALAFITAFLATRRSDRQPSSAPTWIPVLWLVATLVFLFGFTTIDSGFIRTLAFLVPPLIVVISVYEKIPIRLLLGLAVVGAIVQFAMIDIVPGPNLERDSAVEEIAAIPEQSWFVGDDPGMGWSARRLSHPATVDPSFARFETGYLTASEIESALANQKVCVFFATSGRFDAAGVTAPVDYLETPSTGVYRRADC